MSGYGHRNENFAGIHDDLFVKAGYIENKGKKLLIITFDLCHYLYDLNERIMDYAESKYKIPPECVIVNYSHTHAGPKITSPSEKGEPSPLDSFYLERACTCIDRAMLNIYEGTLYISKTTGRWNVNRRKDSESGFVMEPNYTAPTDNEVYVLVVKDTERNIRMVFVNYSCHPVTLSGTLYISGEFPGRVCNILESRYYGATAFYLQSAAGNMRPLVTADKGLFKACSFRELDEFSTSIANEVEKTICSGEFQELDAKPEALKFNLELPIEPFSLDKLKKMLDESDGFTAVRLQRTINNYDDIPDTALVHCGIIKLTPRLYIAYMGGEICYEVKQIVRKVFEPNELVFLGYHESLTYIPNNRIIREGGYEGLKAPLNAGFRGPFKIGINDVIADAFKVNLDKIK
jgi:hypothetical protein